MGDFDVWRCGFHHTVGCVVGYGSEVLYLVRFVQSVASNE